MKTSFTFKSISHNGKIVSKKIKMDTPEFEDEIISDIAGTKINPITVTKEKKAVWWLDEQDKRDLMDSEDWQMILDYKVTPSRVTKPSVEQIVRALNLDERLATDLLAVAKDVAPKLKGISNPKKVEILISHVTIGYKSSTETMTRILKLLQEPTRTGDSKLLGPLIQNESTL